MLALFKETRKLYWQTVIWGTISGLFLLVFVDTVFQRGPISLYFIIFLILWVNLVSFACEKIASRKYSKWVSALINDCDPVQFTHIYKSEIEPFLHKKLLANWSIKISVLITLSTAHLSAGNFLEAKETLSQVKPLLMVRAKPVYQFAFATNSLMLALEEGKLEEAEHFLKQMEKLLNDKKASRTLKEKERSDYQNIKMLLEVEKDCGKYEDYKKLLIATIESTDTPLRRLALKYRLGTVYLHLGEPAKAKELLESVSNHSGSTIYKKKAMEHCQEQNMQNQNSIDGDESFSFPRLFPKKQRTAITVYLLALYLFTIGSAFSSFAYIGFNYGWGFEGFIQFHNTRWEENFVFHPSLEEALNHFAEENRVNREIVFPEGLGEVLFTDTHEESIVLFHEYGEQFYLTFFKRKTENSEITYAFIMSFDWAWVIDLSQDAYFHRTLEHLLRTTIAFNNHITPPLTRVIGRIPIYGYATDENIHKLTINRQSADYIVPIKSFEYETESYYFFYFADIPMLHQDDIELEDFIIAIDGEQMVMEIPSGDYSNPDEFGIESIISIFFLGGIGFIVWKYKRRKRRR